MFSYVNGAHKHNTIATWVPILNKMECAEVVFSKINDLDRRDVSFTTPIKSLMVPLNGRILWDDFWQLIIILTSNIIWQKYAEFVSVKHSLILNSTFQEKNYIICQLSF